MLYFVTLRYFIDNFSLRLSLDESGPGDSLRLALDENGPGER